MNDEQKNKAKEAHGKLQGCLEGWGVPSNWAKVGAALIIGATIGGMSTCTSCKHVPHVELTVEQVQAAEGVYTALGGEVRYRVIPVESVKK